MELIEALKKYRYQIAVNKTHMYKELQQYKEQIVEEGFSFTIKTMQDLFDLEVIVKGILTKKAIEQCYGHFVTQNYDTFEYINYDQKRKMFNHDLSIVLPDFWMFHDQQTKVAIYIPFLESVINQRYIEDYQLLKLKQHEKHLKEYLREYDACRNLYGVQPYISTFSSLIYIDKRETNVYLYCKDTKSVFVYDTTGVLQTEFCVLDKYSQQEPNIEEVAICVEKWVELGDNKALDYMLEKEFIREKTYTKIKKKLG